MEEVEYEEESTEPTSRRFQLSAVWFHVAKLRAGVLFAHSQFWEGIANEFGYHTNWRIDRQRFKEDAGYDIERIAQGVYPENTR